MKHARTAGLTVAVTTAALVLAACGSSSGSTGAAAPSSSPTSPAASATTAKALTSAELEARLLTASDMPSGYALSDDADNEDNTGCAALDALTRETKDEPTATATFDKGELDPTLITSLSTMERSDPAAEFARGRSTITNCGTLKTDDGAGTTIRFTVKAVPITLTGDESFAVKATGTYQGTPVTMVSVYARTGSTLAEVDMQALGTAPDIAVAESLLAKAVAKVKTAQGA